MMFNQSFHLYIYIYISIAFPLIVVFFFSLKILRMLLKKELKNSDVGSLGRIVLPKVCIFLTLILDLSLTLSPPISIEQ